MIEVVPCVREEKLRRIDGKKTKKQEKGKLMYIFIIVLVIYSSICCQSKIVHVNITTTNEDFVTVDEDFATINE